MAYRIGFLTDGPAVGKTYADIIDWVLREPDFTPVLIVQNTPQRSGGAPARLRDSLLSAGIAATLARVLFSLVVRTERLFMGKEATHFHGIEVPVSVVERVEVKPQLKPGGYVYRFGCEDIDRIRALDLDVIIRCGSGVLRGDILHAAKHGILSLHHGDNRTNRGGPPGFWEVYRREPQTGFIVQRLTAELDGGDVLFRGNVPTIPRFLRNQTSVYEYSTEVFLKVLRDVLKGWAQVEEPQPYAGPLYRAPGLSVVLVYMTRLAATLVRSKWNTLTGIETHWRVGYLHGNWRSISLRRARYLTNPPRTFVADPFVVSYQGRTIVFVEEFPYATRKGVIAAYELLPSGDATRLGVALEESFHLSFPMLVRDGEDLFMVPETLVAGQVRLYRCIEYPLKWVLDTVLLDGVSAVDSVLFQRQKRWWMLTGIRKSGSSAVPQSLYYSDALRGPWTPSPENPIVVDTDRTRNGGLLSSDDKLVRIVQRGDYGEYGSSVGLYQIDEVTERSFKETEIASLRAEFLPNLGGMHHLHNDGDVLVFDCWERKRPR
ncbi:MAG: hypothetical protein ABIP07_02405 [Sphingomicrobium sp.]